MKQQIKEALQQGHKNLGLSEEVFERVAAFAETFVTEETGIESFVTSEKTLDLLKSYQSVADKARASVKQKNEPTPPAPDTPKEEPKQEVNIAKIVAAAVAQAINPLQADFEAFKANQSEKSALAALNELKTTWDYAKNYPSECEDAYEATLELYEVGGKKWTADELKAKFTEKFNKAVGKKGVDTTKPFKGDGGNANKTDFSDHVKMLKAQGLLKG